MPSEAVELLEPQQVSEVLDRWQTADPPFAKTLRAGIHPAQALSRLGIRLCLQERYPEALAVLRAATTLTPNDHLLWNNLAVVLQRAALLPEAIKSLKHSLALNHQQPDSWLLLGNMLKEHGDLRAAESAYQTTLTLQPNSPLAWQSLGLLKQEQRQFHQAIDCFLTCANSGNATAPILSILGQLFYQTGQFQKSLHAYSAAANLDPQNNLYPKMRWRLQFICDIINSQPVDAALAVYQQNLPPTTDPKDRDIPELLQTTFSVLSAYGHTEPAKRLGQKRLELAPTSPTANYLLQALNGDTSITRSPDAYLVEHFDAFADGFDHQLTTTLRYDIPQKLCAILAHFLPKNTPLDILDAGCGTGLCAPHIHPFARTLTGIDLSPKMLDHARKRNLYNALICEELTSFLNKSPNSADLLLAADVMIYFGDLAPLLAAIATALRPGAFVAFSTESSDIPHQLLPSGRFAHNPTYVRSIAAPNFIECAFTNTPIRLEAGTPVSGNLFIFQRR